jgi:hypothetical protein
MRLALCFGVLALPALAQLDSAALRAKFGAPLNRETFRLRPGFDIVGDYGANHQVCKMEMPTSITRGETMSFLEGLVPDSTPGKEVINRTGGGAYGVEEHIYERVGITMPGEWGSGTVRFRSEACQP